MMDMCNSFQKIKLEVIKGMLNLKIIDNKGNVKVEKNGSDINFDYEATWEVGDKIKVLLDGCNYISVKLDDTLKESIVYVPSRSFEFIIPNENVQSACYNPKAFKGDKHNLKIREVEDDEVYSYRNLALNSHDMRGRARSYPHASANFVTREEPCFYERNAIDGDFDNQGHGGYPYHSWAGGARNDLEFTLDFGREVEVDKIVLYLRADFIKDKNGEPHDSYWKTIDIEFSDGEIVEGNFVLDRDTFPSDENRKGKVVQLKEKKVTKKIKLYNFVQATEQLSFAALSQIEVYGNIIKENLDKMEVRQASNAKDVKHYTTERLREEFHIKNLFTKDNVRMVYSHIDRIITAGLMPVYQVLKLEAGKELAADYFLQRREMGCINVGGKGIITIDGVKYEMNPRDGIYIGMGNKDITFESVNENAPAKFYVSSCPAHTSYPIVKIDITKAKKVPCGSAEECNKRVINQYIHPEVIKSCQLAMGLTQLEVGSNWNTMPCTTEEWKCICI